MKTILILTAIMITTQAFSMPTLGFKARSHSGLGTEEQERQDQNPEVIVADEPQTQGTEKRPQDTSDKNPAPCLRDCMPYTHPQ